LKQALQNNHPIHLQFQPITHDFIHYQTTIMQFTTLAIFLLTSTLTTAAPTTLSRRSCQVSYPASIGFPINYSIYQSANGANARTDAITFTNIPPGSFGCQLEVNFPPNYPISSSGSSAINIIALEADGSKTLFGTVTLKSGPEATKIVVNSAVCAGTMSYIAEIASETQAGSVGFAEIQGAGFMMVYDC
jgi:hypothetical protein